MQLMGGSIDLSNQIRSTLKTSGLRAGKGVGRAFEQKARGLIADRPAIAMSCQLVQSVTSLIDPAWANLSRGSLIHVARYGTGGHAQAASEGSRLLPPLASQSRHLVQVKPDQ